MKVLVPRIFLLAMILACLCINATAHSNSQDGLLGKGYIAGNYNNYYIGGEDVGWAIIENRHSGSTSIQYKFDSSVSQTKRTYVRNGAQMWSSVATIRESSTATSVVHEDDYGTLFIAAVSIDTREDLNSETGHIVKWTMYLNEYFDFYKDGMYAVDSSTTAHEFGHTIGLTDLYLNQNRNKLMCGYEDRRTAAAPTNRDLWGARVILGLHTTHSFTNYRYYGIIDDEGYHSKCCSECGGNAVDRTPCVYSTDNENEMCIYCGTNRTY